MHFTTEVSASSLYCSCLKMAHVIAVHILSQEENANYLNEGPYTRLHKMLDLLMKVLPPRIYSDPLILSTIFRGVQEKLYHRMEELSQTTESMAHLRHHARSNTNLTTTGILHLMTMIMTRNQILSDLQAINLYFTLEELASTTPTTN